MIVHFSSAPIVVMIVLIIVVGAIPPLVLPSSWSQPMLRQVEEGLRVRHIVVVQLLPSSHTRPPQSLPRFASSHHLERCSISSLLRYYFLLCFLCVWLLLLRSDDDDDVVFVILASLLRVEHVYAGAAGPARPVWLLEKELKEWLWL